MQRERGVRLDACGTSQSRSAGTTCREPLLVAIRLQVLDGRLFLSRVGHHPATGRELLSAQRCHTSFSPLWTSYHHYNKIVPDSSHFERLWAMVVRYT
jgi:hypothetical protein